MFVYDNNYDYNSVILPDSLVVPCCLKGLIFSFGKLMLNIQGKS